MAQHLIDKFAFKARNMSTQRVYRNARFRTAALAVAEATTGYELLRRVLVALAEPVTIRYKKAEDAYEAKPMQHMDVAFLHNTAGIDAATLTFKIPPFDFLLAGDSPDNVQQLEETYLRVPLPNDEAVAYALDTATVDMPFVFAPDTYMVDTVLFLSLIHI